MEEKPTQSREGVKGGFPLAGSRGSAPCGVWGNAPTVPRQTNHKEAANKSAGSEASLPVTSRVLRRAPKPLYPLLAHCRAKWARPHSRSTAPRPCFPTSKRIPKPKKIQEKPAAQNRWFFQSPEIFTSSAPPDESAGTSARSPQTRTSWGAVHAARDSAPTGRSKAECSAPATIG